MNTEVWRLCALVRRVSTTPGRARGAALRSRQEAVSAESRAENQRKPRAYGKICSFPAAPDVLGSRVCLQVFGSAEPDLPETLTFRARNGRRVPIFCGTPARERQGRRRNASRLDSSADRVTDRFGAPEWRRASGRSHRGEAGPFGLGFLLSSAATFVGVCRVEGSGARVATWRTWPSGGRGVLACRGADGVCSVGGVASAGEH